jgi:hypothetical protein
MSATENMASVVTAGSAVAESKADVAQPCQLVVYNRAGEIIGGVSAASFMDFKRRCGGQTAVAVELDCGALVVVDSCKVFKKLPKATYKARLLKKTTAIPKELAQDAVGCSVWVEA